MNRVMRMFYWSWRTGKMTQSPDQPLINETSAGISVLAGLAALMTTRSFIAGALAGMVVLILCTGYIRGWWGLLWLQIKPQLIDLWQWLRSRGKVQESEPYKVYLGYSLATREDVIADIRTMKGIGLWAVTSGGKSAFLHLLIIQLISNHSPEQIQIAISDLKEVEMNIYDSIPHLFCPIAFSVQYTDEMMRLVMAEKVRRAKLFNLVSGGRVKRVCNNLDRYHELKRELGLDLPDLPILMVIFDETSEFVRGTGSENNMVTLAEQGRAYGIFPVCATQNPISESIPTTVRRQLVSRFVGIMPASAYQYADVPKEVHKANGELSPGQFYASIGNSGARYELIQAPLVSPGEIEAVANALSRGRTPPAWPEKAETREPDAPEQWAGSDEDKRRLLFAWFEELQQAGKQPRPTVFAKKFGVVTQTYYNYKVTDLWKEYVD